MALFSSPLPLETPALTLFSPFVLPSAPSEAFAITRIESGRDNPVAGRVGVDAFFAIVGAGSTEPGAFFATAGTLPVLHGAFSLINALFCVAAAAQSGMIGTG